MGFDSLKQNLKSTYYTTEDDVIGGFFEPILTCSKSYDRGAGYFSSSVLIGLSKGIKRLVNNNGKIRVITSPNFTKEDIAAIMDGYDRRKTDKIIERVIIRDLGDPQSDEDHWHLGFLSWLIENKFMDIKVAFMQGGAIYHEKFGIFTDGEGEKIAFAGSSNETAHGLLSNYERLDVYPYWDSVTKVNEFSKHFDRIWNDNAGSIKVMEFPKVARDKLHCYQPYYINNKDKYAIPETITAKAEQAQPAQTAYEKAPRLPDKNLRDYQNEAIGSWKAHNFRGIFDMATGTGKTYTALGALVCLYNHCNSDLAVVICCPYRHLVEQWVEDLRQFDIDPIIGYSESQDRNWRARLSNAVDIHNRLSRFFCFITTNRTFNSEFVQQEINRLNQKSLLIADEAHYMGSATLSKNLPQNFNYRLALSATIERFNDIMGTKAIYEYFGEKCIEYDLDMAIRAGMLSKYDYHPVIVYLTEEELSEYKSLTKSYARIAYSKKDGQIPDAAKSLLLKRARIIAGAAEKLPKLKEVITPYKDESHILVYCGVADIDADSKDPTEPDSRQIDSVCRLLGNDLDMRVSRFTSQEDMKERKDIRQKFSNSFLQALVAIKCLDEGFNIPEIRVAFILASTTNPKEYIQRLGRVLRISEGKDVAEIYDFVTLPRTPQQAKTLSEREQQYEKGLVAREYIRMLYYNSQANNKIDNEHHILMDLQEIYKLYDLYDISDKSEWDGLDLI